MKQLHLTTMCIVCAVLMGFLSSCSKNEEEPNVPSSGGQTGPTEETKTVLWDGEYPSIADAKLLLQKAVIHEGDEPNHKNYVVILSSAEHLAAMNVLVTNNEIIKSPEGVQLTCRRLRYRLTTDIDLDNKYWTSIGGLDGNNAPSFYGDFDGQGHTIKNLKVYVNDPTSTTDLHAALFAVVTPSSDNPFWGIRHLIVEGAIDVTTSRYGTTGGIVAHNKGGNIHFCRFNGSISVGLRNLNNYSSYARVGGIAGLVSENAVVAGCISNASCELDIRNLDNDNLVIAQGQLIGLVNSNRDGITVNYSAWNSNGEAAGIDSIRSPEKVILEYNNAYAGIPALNALLPDMNAVPRLENSYIWQANSNTENYPLLVEKK